MIGRKLDELGAEVNLGADAIADQLAQLSEQIEALRTTIATCVVCIMILACWGVVKDGG